MKKLSTGIEGLDTLFYGGIQQNVNESDNGIIIVLRGTKGCNKTLMAMQLMQGLICSRYNNETNNYPTGHFLSLNKTRENLSDMYYDLIIARLINTLCQYWSKTQGKNRQKLSELFDYIINFFFVPTAKPKELYDRKSLIELFVSRAIYYNPRTNGLHYRRLPSGDDEENILWKRKKDDELTQTRELNRKIVHSNWFKQSLDLLLDVQYKENIRELFCDENNRKYEGQPLTLVQNIINMLAAQESQTDKKFCCLVIDGFSRLLTSELASLPYAQIEKLLREKTDIAILVTDERTEAQFNSDILIDMRKSEEPEEEYIYHELQISKSVFQMGAYGWHQYKKRDSGIEVFPSIHMLLSKRNYLPYKLLTMNNDILQESYEEYLEYSEYRKNKNEDYRQEIQEISNYYEQKEQRERDLLLTLAKTTRQAYQTKDHSQMITDLKNVLWGNLSYYRNYEEDKSEPRHGWEDHLPSTAIIGNPNSNKRQMAIAGALHAARNGEHTIFILFDKNEADMRRRMGCPGFRVKETDCPGGRCSKECNSKNQCSINKCRECYQYIHFFQIRMGCISAEEFFDALLKQIRNFSNFTDDKPCHIVIDDLQKIDYSFPFLKKAPLFLSALITLCRQNYAELKMICDKRASMVGELCTLSDNVLCVYRDEADINKMIIYMERNFGGVHSSGLAKYRISDTNDLFYCENNELKLKEENIETTEIASMKEYWRKTKNVILKNKENC